MSRRLILAIFGMLSVVCLGFAGGFAQKTPEYATLQARAGRIFAYDLTHPGRLPRNAVITLSVALEFHDVNTENVIASLEGLTR